MRHTTVYSTATILGTNLVDPPDIGVYMLTPPPAATYHITNSLAPHTVHGFPDTSACGKSVGRVMEYWNILLSGLQLERPELHYNMQP